MAGGRPKNSKVVYTEEADNKFVALVQSGVSRPKAFVAAYPAAPVSLRFLSAERNSAEYRRYYKQIVTAAFKISISEHVQRAAVKYADRMEEFSDVALKTATDLVQNARSEKVRADLAVEGIRHKVGNPTQKILEHSETTVTLSFSPPPSKEKKTVIDGEAEDDF